MEINTKLTYVLFAIGAITIWYYDTKRPLLKAKKAFQNMINYLDEYELQIKRAFEDYKLNQKVIKYDTQNEKSKVVITSKYIDANIDKAFFDMKNRLIGKMINEVYTYSDRKKLNGHYYDKFIKLFFESSDKTKLEFVNGEMEEFATQVAIENYITKDDEIGLAGEFISLWVYNTKTLYGYHYPEGTYENLKKGKKIRIENPKEPKDKFWEIYNYQ